MVWLNYHSSTCLCYVAHEMGFIPILCDCDVRFQYIQSKLHSHPISPCEQNTLNIFKNAVAHRTVWTSHYCVHRQYWPWSLSFPSSSLTNHLMSEYEKHPGINCDSCRHVTCSFHYKAFIYMPINISLTEFPQSSPMSWLYLMGLAFWWLIFSDQYMHH